MHTEKRASRYHIGLIAEVWCEAGIQFPKATFLFPSSSLLNPLWSNGQKSQEYMIVNRGSQGNDYLSLNLALSVNFIHSKQSLALISLLTYYQQIASDKESQRADWPRPGSRVPALEKKLLPSPPPGGGNDQQWVLWECSRKDANLLFITTLQSRSYHHHLLNNRGNI